MLENSGAELQRVHGYPLVDPVEQRREIQVRRQLQRREQTVGRGGRAPGHEGHGAVQVALQGTQLYPAEGGGFDARAVSEALRKDVVEIMVNLHAGEAEGAAWGCDLSYDYVKINAMYTT